MPGPHGPARGRAWRGRQALPRLPERGAPSKDGWRRGYREQWEAAGQRARGSPDTRSTRTKLLRSRKTASRRRASSSSEKSSSRRSRSRVLRHSTRVRALVIELPGLVRSGKNASLTENGTQNDRRIDVADHRWLWRSSRRIIHDVAPGLQRGRQLHLAWRRRAGLGPMDHEHVPFLVERNEARDGDVPVRHRQRPPAPCKAHVMRQPCLQVRDRNTAHDQIIVLSGHPGVAAASDPARPPPRGP